jgi:hypothetical protein
VIKIDAVDANAEEREVVLPLPEPMDGTTNLLLTVRSTTPPLAAEAVIPVLHPTPTVQHPPIPMSSPSDRKERLHVAPRVGFFSNLGKIHVPHFGAELAYRPFEETRFRASVVVDYYTASAGTADANGQLSVRSRLHAVPMALRGIYLVPEPVPGIPVNILLGAGLNVHVVYVSVAVPTQPDQSLVDVAVGASVLAGYEFELGPGDLSTQASYVLLPAHKQPVDLRRRGVGLTVEYAIPLW